MEIKKNFENYSLNKIGFEFSLIPKEIQQEILIYVLKISGELKNISVVLNERNKIYLYLFDSKIWKNLRLVSKSFYFFVNDNYVWKKLDARCLLISFPRSKYLFGLSECIKIPTRIKKSKNQTDPRLDKTTKIPKIPKKNCGFCSSSQIEEECLKKISKIQIAYITNPRIFDINIVSNFACCFPEFSKLSKLYHKAIESEAEQTNYFLNARKQFEEIRSTLSVIEKEHIGEEIHEYLVTKQKLKRKYHKFQSKYETCEENLENSIKNLYKTEIKFKRIKHLGKLM